jgi:hypothetical protein
MITTPLIIAIIMLIVSGLKVEKGIVVLNVGIWKIQILVMQNI